MATGRAGDIVQGSAHAAIIRSALGHVLDVFLAGTAIMIATL